MCVCRRYVCFSAYIVTHTVYQPPIITGETTVTEDDTLTLECNTQNSFGQPAAQWFNEAGQQVSMTSILKVENISRTEDGTYTCRTSTMDPVNSRNSSAVVVVQCEFVCVCVCACACELTIAWQWRKI